MNAWQIRIASLLTFSMMFSGCSQTATPEREMKSIAPVTQSVEVQIGESPKPLDEGYTFDELAADLDRDGSEEKLRLFFAKGDLYLQAGQQRIVVMDHFDEEDVDVPDTTNMQRPSLSLVMSREGKPMVLVSVVWPTNRIGSKAELWLYGYDGGHLVKRWQLGEERQPVAAVYAKGKGMDIGIPMYGVQNHLMYAADMDAQIDHAVQMDGMEALQVDFGTPTAYRLRNSDGDGRYEIWTSRLMTLGGSTLSVGTLYVSYEISDKAVRPKLALVADTIQRYFVELLIQTDADTPLWMNAKEIGVPKVLANYGYTNDQVEAALERMVRDGIMKREGGFYRLLF